MISKFFAAVASGFCWNLDADRQMTPTYFWRQIFINKELLPNENWLSPRGKALAGVLGTFHYFVPSTMKKECLEFQLQKSKCFTSCQLAGKPLALNNWLPNPKTAPIATWPWWSNSEPLLSQVSLTFFSDYTSKTFASVEDKCSSTVCLKWKKLWICLNRVCKAHALLSRSC